MQKKTVKFSHGRFAGKNAKIMELRDGNPNNITIELLILHSEMHIEEQDLKVIMSANEFIDSLDEDDRSWLRFEKIDRIKPIW